MKLLIAPDRLALYRYSVFAAIAGEYVLSVVGSTKRDKKDIPLFSEYVSESPFKIIPLPQSIIIKGRVIWQIALIAEVIRTDADVVIFWGEAHRLSTWLAAAVSRLRGKKTISWGHGIYGHESFIKLTYRKLFYKMFDGNLVYGEYAKNKGSEKGIDFRVVGNTLTPIIKRKIVSKFPKFEKPHKVAETQSIVLCYLGRASKSKKCEQLIRLVNNSSKYKLVHIGPVWAGFGALTKEKFTYMGETYCLQEINNILLDVDICISPGNAGLNILTSLICDTPIITHNSFSHQMPEIDMIVDHPELFFERDKLPSIEFTISELIKKIRKPGYKLGYWNEIAQKYCPQIIAENVSRELNELYYNCREPK